MDLSRERDDDIITTRGVSGTVPTPWDSCHVVLNPHFPVPHPRQHNPICFPYFAYPSSTCPVFIFELLPPIDCQVLDSLRPIYSLRPLGPQPRGRNRGPLSESRKSSSRCWSFYVTASNQRPSQQARPRLVKTPPRLYSRQLRRNLTVMSVRDTYWLHCPSEQ